MSKALRVISRSKPKPKPLLWAGHITWLPYMMQTLFLSRQSEINTNIVI